MKDDLLKEKPSYKPMSSDTPYQRAKQQWDVRIGSARVQAHNWRLACILSLIICLILLIIVVLLIIQNKQKVFIAQLGKQGQVTNVAPLMQTYEPTVAQYQYIIGQFIQKTMRLSLDPDVVKRSWLSSYMLVSGKAKLQLDELARRAKLTELVGKVTKTVKINSIQQITPNSYEAKWVQKIISREGKLLETNQYLGVFTVAHQQPRTLSEILQNPLGVKIIYFTLQENI